MFDYLMEFYGIEQSKSGMTFSDLFLKWIEYKTLFVGSKNRHKGLSPSTIKRYKNDYERFFGSSDIINKPIGQITKPDLEGLIAGLISDHKLPEKQANNVIGYVAGMFSYAYDADMIDRDPAAKLDRALLLSRCVSETSDDTSRILSRDEIVLLKSAITRHEQEHRYAPDYAAELALLTGMRVGELAALKWESIHDGYIHIDYSEHRLDFDDHTELVIGEPKCGKHRMIPLTEDMQDVLDRVKDLGYQSLEGFVFVSSDGSRCTGHDIGCGCVRRGKEAGIKSNVSIHRIRRTVSSLLHENLTETAVAALLGHTERVNKECYTYDISDYQEKLEALNHLPKTDKIIPFQRVS